MCTVMGMYMSSFEGICCLKTFWFKDYNLSISVCLHEIIAQSSIILKEGWD